MVNERRNEKDIKRVAGVDERARRGERNVAKGIAYAIYSRRNARVRGRIYIS